MKFFIILVDQNRNWTFQKKNKRNVEQYSANKPKYISNKHKNKKNDQLKNKTILQHRLGIDQSENNTIVEHRSRKSSSLDKTKGQIELCWQNEQFGNNKQNKLSIKQFSDTE